MIQNGVGTGGWGTRLRICVHGELNRGDSTLPNWRCGSGDHGDRGNRRKEQTWLGSSMSCQNVAGNLRFRCARATDRWGSVKRARAGAGVAWTTTAGRGAGGRDVEATAPQWLVAGPSPRTRDWEQQQHSAGPAAAAAQQRWWGRASAAAGHRGPWVTGSRRCSQSSQGATEPRPGRDGLGRPTRDSARARGASRQGNAEHDDTVTTHTRGSNRGREVHGFKALTVTKPLLLNLNRFHYTQGGIWGY